MRSVTCLWCFGCIIDKKWIQRFQIHIIHVSGARVNRGVGLLGAEVLIASTLLIFGKESLTSKKLQELIQVEFHRTHTLHVHVRSKHCNYYTFSCIPLYTFSYIVHLGLHCSCTSVPLIECPDARFQIPRRFSVNDWITSVASVSFFLAIRLDEQAVNHTNRRFLSSKTSNRQFFATFSLKQMLAK